MDFEFVGKISMGKETDKFKPYEESLIQDKWQKKRLKFNVACGTNRHFLTVDSFDAADGTGRILVLSKSDGDKKGEQFFIDFKDRFTSSRLKDVADFKKFVVDLGDRKKRYDLKRLVDKIETKEVITDEELESVGCEDETEVKKAYADSLKLHKEFIAKTDFIDFIKKLIDSGKYADSKFRIRGQVVHSYNEDNADCYTNYVPQKIYLADDADETSTANLKFLFGADSLDKDTDSDKYLLNGWTMSYEQRLKKNIPVPVSVVIPATDKDKADKIAKRFSAMGDEIKEIGIEVHVINGSSRIEITRDMLTEEQVELLDLGLVDMDELRAELGNTARGEAIKEYRIKGFTRGYTNGAQDTAWLSSDMVIATADEIDDDISSLFD